MTSFITNSEAGHSGATSPPHEQGPALPPGPVYWASTAFAVPHDLGFRLVERWQFNLVQVLKAQR